MGNRLNGIHIVDSPSAILTRGSLSSATQNQNWERSDQPNTQAEKVFRFESKRRQPDCRVDSLAGRCAPSSDCVPLTLKAIQSSNEKMVVSQLCNYRLNGFQSRSDSWVTGLKPRC